MTIYKATAPSIAATPSAWAWPPRRQALWALAILLLAYVLAFVDRIILSILIGPIKAELHLSDMQFALIGGLAFSMFYVTVGMPIGWLSDRFSRRWIVALGIALWSLCTAASGLAPSFGWLFVARMGVGIGEAALSPAAYSLIADYFAPQHRGRAVAVYTLGVSLGSALAYLLGGLLIGFTAHHGLLDLPAIGSLAPWRFVFVAVGLPGLVVAVVTLTMREPPRRSLHTRETVDAAAAADAHAGARPDPGLPDPGLPNPGLPDPGLFAFLRAHRAVSAAYVLGYSFINLPFAGFLLWGPALYQRVHGMGPPQLSLPLALIFLVPTTLGQIGGAALTDRWLARGRPDAAFRTGLWCAMLLVPCAIAMPLLAGAGASLAALAVLVFLVCASVGHHAVIAASVAPNRLRGQYIALFFFVQNVFGQVVISIVTAFLTDRVFADPASIGRSMAIVGGGGAALGAITLALGRPALRRTVVSV